MFKILFSQPLANGLVLFYKVLGENMGFAIIFFSLFLRFILYPLTKPYMDSMKKMKKYTPQLEKIKNKYKDDKLKQAQAQADFYKEKGIKPGAGCLPYLLQIVILIAFFRVFTTALSSNVDPTSAFNELLYEPLKFSDGATINTKFLSTSFYTIDISKPDVFNISWLPFPIPGPLLIITALVQMISSKIMMPYEKTSEKVAEKTEGVGDDFQTAMQKSMVYTYPFITLVIGVRFQSGLALYWLVFSLSQAFIQLRNQGLGGLEPFAKRLGLVKSESEDRKNKRKK
ncbi:membrane protein insertase YidC [Candidatus Woesebacteria bacterium]|nr:membrane protein insertase YidC [Candidatus Woesebacteria bacterium]